MARINILRAWKDAKYRASLSAAERAMLPENPAGAVELTADEAATVEGKLAVAICSGCHGCGGVALRSYAAAINPVVLF
jgi:mersacidin/lichenicidin family type 2 lantibiotic